MLNLGSKCLLDSEELKLGASVVTGLENIAASEICQKLGYTKQSGNVTTCQGRVYIKGKKETLPLMHNLKSIDNLFVILQEYENFVYKDTKEGVYEDLTNMAKALPWSKVVELWEYNLPLCKPKLKQKNWSQELGRKDALFHPDAAFILDSKRPKLSDESLDSHDLNESTCLPYPPGENGVPRASTANKLIKFRVTTNRVGKKQPITSPEASYKFGGEIQDFTQWKVDLSNFNLEVLLNLGESSVQVALALTRQSLHRRNITHFGVTTLRATTAYCMLRMCDIQPGETVIDPMCGSGAIPVEGSLEWRNSFHIAGDNVQGAIDRCRGNLQFINNNPEFVNPGFSPQKLKRINLPADLVLWDVTNLPLRSDYIDVIVSDLPFGKRMGSKVDNRQLYPATLREMARVAKCGTARACLLTQDKRTMKRVVDSMLNLWKLSKTTYINIGGLTAGIFLLRRTKNCFEHKTENMNSKQLN